MSPNKFDRHIKSQLQDHHKAVDAEEIWAAIEPQRPRRRWGIWWIFGVLLPLGLAGYVWQQDLLGIRADKFVQQTSINEQSTSLTNEETDQTSFGNSQEEVKSETENLNKANNTNTTTQNSSGNITPKNQNSDLKQNKIANKSFPKNQNNSPLSIPSSSSETELESESTIFEATAPVPASTPILPQAVALSKTQDRSANIVATLALKEIADLPIQGLSFDATPIMPSETEILISEKSSGLYLDLRAGLYAPVRSLEFGRDSLSPEEETLFTERRNSESTLEAWSVDLNLGYQHPSGWYVQSGLGYSQLIEQFEFSDMSTTRDSVPGIVRIILESNGDSTFVEGQVERIQASTFYQVNYNSFRSLDIPVLFGYQFGQDRFGIMAEGGFRVNIQQQQEGVRRGIGGTMIELADSPDFRTQIGLSLQAGVGVNWQFTPALSLSANTSIRYFTGDLTKEGHVIRERYQWLGGQVGLRWFF